MGVFRCTNKPPDNILLFIFAHTVQEGDWWRHQKFKSAKKSQKNGRSPSWICGAFRTLILAQKQVIRGMGSDPIEKWAFYKFDTGFISPECVMRKKISFSIIWNRWISMLDDQDEHSKFRTTRRKLGTFELQQATQGFETNEFQCYIVYLCFYVFAFIFKVLKILEMLAEFYS